MLLNVKKIENIFLRTWGYFQRNIYLQKIRRSRKGEKKIFFLESVLNARIEMKKSKNLKFIVQHMIWSAEVKFSELKHSKKTGEGFKSTKIQLPLASNAKYFLPSLTVTQKNNKILPGGFIKDDNFAKRSVATFPSHFLFLFLKFFKWHEGGRKGRGMGEERKKLTRQLKINHCKRIINEIPERKTTKRYLEIFGKMSQWAKILMESFENCFCR